jgi:hypothetical protein
MMDFGHCLAKNHATKNVTPIGVGVKRRQGGGVGGWDGVVFFCRLVLQLGSRVFATMNNVGG